MQPCVWPITLLLCARLPGQTKIGTGSVRKWSKSRHKAMEGPHWAFIVSRLSQIMFHVQTKQVQNGKGLGTPRWDNPQCRADREGFRLLTTSTDPLLWDRNTFQDGKQQKGIFLKYEYLANARRLANTALAAVNPKHGEMTRPQLWSSAFLKIQYYRKVGNRCSVSMNASDSPGQCLGTLSQGHTKS